jgi:hypothetical protein
MATRKTIFIKIIFYCRQACGSRYWHASSEARLAKQKHPTAPVEATPVEAAPLEAAPLESTLLEAKQKRRHLSARYILNRLSAHLRYYGVWSKVEIKHKLRNIQKCKGQTAPKPNKPMLERKIKKD